MTIAEMLNSVDVSTAQSDPKNTQHAHFQSTYIYRGGAHALPGDVVVQVVIPHVGEIVQVLVQELGVDLAVVGDRAVQVLVGHACDVCWGERRWG